MLRFLLVYHAGPFGMFLAHYFSPRAPKKELQEIGGKVDRTIEDLYSKLDQSNAENAKLMKLIRLNIQANQRIFIELKNSQVTLTQNFESLKREIDQIKLKMNSVGTPSTAIA